MYVTYAMSFHLYYVLLLLKTIERYPLGSLPVTDAETEAMVCLRGVLLIHLSPGTLPPS